MNKVSWDAFLCEVRVIQWVGNVTTDTETRWLIIKATIQGEGFLTKGHSWPPNESPGEVEDNLGHLQVGDRADYSSSNGLNLRSFRGAVRWLAISWKLGGDLGTLITISRALAKTLIEPESEWWNLRALVKLEKTEWTNISTFWAPVGAKNFEQGTCLGQLQTRET